MSAYIYKDLKTRKLFCIERERDLWKLRQENEEESTVLNDSQMEARIRTMYPHAGQFEGKHYEAGSGTFKGLCLLLPAKSETKRHVIQWHDHKRKIVDPKPLTYDEAKAFQRHAYAVPSKEIMAKVKKAFDYTGILPGVKIALPNLKIAVSAGTQILVDNASHIAVLGYDLGQLRRLLGVSDELALAVATTHELAHYIYDAGVIKQSDKLAFKAKVSGKLLHSNTIEHYNPRGFDSEQFAILAEHLVWGSSARGVMNSSGVEIVRKYFVENFTIS